MPQPAAQAGEERLPFASGPRPAAAANSSARRLNSSHSAAVN